jgi:hypothetical protein
MFKTKCSIGKESLPIGDSFRREFIEVIGENKVIGEDKVN